MSRPAHMCDLYTDTHQNRAAATVVIDRPTWITRLCTPCVLNWLNENYGEWQIVDLNATRRGT